MSYTQEERGRSVFLWMRCLVQTYNSGKTDEKNNQRSCPERQVISQYSYFILLIFCLLIHMSSLLYLVANRFCIVTVKLQIIIQSIIVPQ